MLQKVCEVAKRFSLYENTETSRTVGTLISLVPGPYGFGMGVRQVEDRLIVDFNLLEKDRVNFRPTFTKLMLESQACLHDHFGERFIIPDKSEFREIRNYLDPSKRGVDATCASQDGN